MSQSPAAGHGAIHEQIVEVTAKIRADPGNAELYVKRGELHRVERHWDAALEDYARAFELAPELAGVALSQARTLLDADRPEPALVAIDQFLERMAAHSKGRVTRARILSRLGRHAEAAREYTKAIADQDPSGRPNAELYLQRARALAAGGQDLGEALRGLDEGMALVGPLMTLQLLAIDLERARGRFDAALSRLETVAAQSSRKDSWLLLRGEILDQAGMPEAARQAYAQALAAIESLPAAHRRTKGTLELEARARAGLAQNADP